MFSAEPEEALPPFKKVDKLTIDLAVFFNGSQNPVLYNQQNPPELSSKDYVSLRVLSPDQRRLWIKVVDSQGSFRMRLHQNEDGQEVGPEKPYMMPFTVQAISEGQKNRNRIVMIICRGDFKDTFDKVFLKDFSKQDKDAPCTKYAYDL
jgi:hypothetical protein